MAGQRKRRNRKAEPDVGSGNNHGIDMFMMIPCIGIPGHVPPLCTWKELEDGTYNLADVYRFNEMLKIVAEEHNKNNK